MPAWLIVVRRITVIKKEEMKISIEMILGAYNLNRNNNGRHNDTTANKNDNDTNNSFFQLSMWLTTVGRSE